MVGLDTEACHRHHAGVNRKTAIHEKSQLAFRTRPGTGLEYAVYFMPRRTIACERIFQEQGVYGDIVAGEFPLGFIPFDYDLLSLEQGSAFRVRHLFSSIGILQR